MTDAVGVTDASRGWDREEGKGREVGREEGGGKDRRKGVVGCARAGC